MSRLKYLCFILCCSFTSANLYAQQLEAVQLYSQDELIKLINQNLHLERVVSDRCQLVRDIEARADVLQIPAYQFLWGDMLAWGVCVDADPKLGIYHIRNAADQGLPAALEQLGRYHALGTLVQEDKQRAVIYLREASALGNLKAQLQLAKLFIDGYGSPYDFEDLYHWLYNAITNDRQMHQEIAMYMLELEALMHPKAVRNARKPMAY
ncbi:tetratricopeptide repeat protein [Agaribacter flavus]|uniref:Tetratricopeptide repeat protein n=1 Tax=Agaribacter flavus TaxID=1902781 RepID=A0ABV7FR81_9ALTE